ncbi:MAG TPA: hypothetical protein PLU30_27850 [Verrucomicrobiae bacterium]|nr:hypothetical protein [Verrucomicrobiae bacterium]
MSWEEARKAALEWLAKAGVKRELHRQIIDLTDLEGLLPPDMKPNYKVMVIRAAMRIVRKRGGTPTTH